MTKGKVYVVVDISVDPGNVFGVFSTRALADAEIKKVDENTGSPFEKSDFEIHECEVDVVSDDYSSEGGTTNSPSDDGSSQGGPVGGHGTFPDDDNLNGLD